MHVADGLSKLVRMDGMPANRRNDSKYLHTGGAVRAAESLLYKAAASLNSASKAEAETAWATSSDPMAELYRAVRSLKLPTE